jgi:hypothetical protein
VTKRILVLGKEKSVRDKEPVVGVNNETLAL